MLRNVSEQDISVTVLGHKLSMPICVSPTAYQAMAHPDGELATVRGKLAAVTLKCDLLGRIFYGPPHPIKYYKTYRFLRENG